MYNSSEPVTKNPPMYTQNLLCFQTQPSSRKQSGLTMIELLVTLAIAAILLSIGVPSFTRMMADWRLKNAVNAFNGGLRVARTEAIARRKVVKLCATNDTAECVDGADYSKGWIVYTGEKNKPNTLITQQALTGFSSIKPGATVTIHFLPTGIMRGSAGATFTFTTNAYKDDTSTAWAQRKITISRTGRVKAVKNKS